MNFVNLTPHEVRVFNGSKLVLTLAPSGVIARVSTQKHRFDNIGEVITYSMTKGEVTGLPSCEGSTVFIVSAMVREACPSRRDLYSPGELVRDEKGQPIGCQGLVKN